jgi:16S rRNA (cytosine967-C5)-methyltransferase
MTLKFLRDNIKFLNFRHENANISLRMNTLNYSIRDEDYFKKITKEIFKNGIEVQRDAHFPELIHVNPKFSNQIIKSRWYKSGDLIFQDKGSSAIVHTLAPKPYELICDMCAAPGIKTSLIAQITKNKARTISGEFLPKRGTEMKNLMKLLNVLNNHTIITDSGQFPTNLYEGFDRVLLDAPCTGSGTLLSNPELKWRQNEAFLRQNLTIQEALLKNAVKLLKPNGILVYSTCSLYPEEGELQVLKVFNELEPMKIPNYFNPSYEINNLIIPGTGRLFPSIHQTQGFFVGKFKKKET